MYISLIPKCYDSVDLLIWDGCQHVKKIDHNSPAAQDNEAACKCLLELGQVTDTELGQFFVWEAQRSLRKYT